MSIYRRDEILPEWEAVPWGMKGAEADAQEAGFQARALKRIQWQAIAWQEFPTDGIFGHDRAWFSERDIEFVASHEGEVLLLIRNIWFGFPDPPEWGLVSRASQDQEWRHWGHFPDLPAAWVVPETTSRA